MDIKVMLVSKQDSFVNQMRQLITAEDITVAADAPGGAVAIEKIENIEPDMLIINSGRNDTEAMNLAERITQNRPRIFVVLVVEEMTVETLQAANAAGVHNVITMPESSKELCDYIHMVHNAESNRLSALSENTQISWMSKCVAVFGSKDGLGKTSLATNLAIKLAENRRKVALVDLDLEFGDVHTFMDINPKDTIAELAQDFYSPTIDAIRSYMTVHPSGVHVLCAPKSPEYADVVSAECVSTILSLLRSYYDFVIVDTASNFNDVTLTAIESASTVFMMTGMDVSTLKNAKLAMSVLESLKQNSKVRVVVNRAVESGSININDVQRIIEAPLAAYIPNDYSVALGALNRGEPFVLSYPKSKLSACIDEISKTLIAGTEEFHIDNSVGRKGFTGFFKNKVNKVK